MPTPPKSLDDMPLAAYGGSGMQDETDANPQADASGAAATEPAQPADASGAVASGAAASGAAAMSPSASSAAPPTSANDLPVPEDEQPRGPSPLERAIHLFRTSRVAAGAGFAVVIVVGLVLLSGGGASPAATAATPTKGPTPVPTVVPPSGDASLVLSGAATGTFPLSGLAGGQQVDATTVVLGWGDAQQTTLSIAGPFDRGTRTTDERLVLTLGVLVKGVPVTFTSNAGQCTVGMAQVSGKLQGSFACHKLKSADGKLTIEASGSYRT